MTKIALHSVRETPRVNRRAAQCSLFNLRISMLVALAFLLLGASSLARAQNYFEKGHSPSFTQAQAESGKTAYATSCANCHGTGLNDGEFGPALKGSAFQQKWGAQSPAALYSYMQQKMPPAAPGQLGSQTYADLEAYILQQNGLTPGAAELSVAAVAGAQAATATKQTFQRDVFRSQSNRDAIYQAAMARRAAELANLAPVTDSVLQHPPDGDWLMWRRTYSGLGYSPLDQIRKSNVSALRLAWSRALPLSANEITPIAHNGVIFIESGSTIQAIDGATGALLWQYVRPLPDVLLNGTGSTIRGIAIYQDKIYAPTADGHMIAVDAKTGKLVWDQEVVVPLTGEYAHSNHDFRLDGAPIVVRGKVIFGVSLGITNPSGGCFIEALDADTGRELWRFHTIAGPGQPGGDSWNGWPVDERFGASVWTSGSYDPKRNLVYFGTGNTYDVSTLLQPHDPQPGDSNDGLYTESTLALDPDTGKLVWYYQHMNRDVWDLDWVFEQLLLTLPVHGKPTDLVVTGGKMAIFDAVDRANGKYEFSKDLGLQNLVVSIDPKTGKKTIDPKLEPVANKPELVCPTSNGARNWPSTSYDPQTHILYVPLAEACMDYTWVPGTPAQTAAGGLDIRFNLRVRPDSDGKMGRLDAVNLETRKIVWMNRQRAPIASAMLTTAGGLLFSGSQNREFTAYDASTGKSLWQAGLNATPSSYPITYSIHGKQYVAVVSGGGGPLDAGDHSLAPEFEDPPGGTTLWIFALPTLGSPVRQ